MTERHAVESRDNDPLDLLRQELTAVSVSAEFATKVRENLDDELGELRDELADVAVSPAFAARVRQRVEERAVQRPWFSMGWRWLVPVAGLAAAAGVVAIWFHPRTATEPRLSVSTTASVPVTTPPDTRSAQPETSIARAPQPARARHDAPVVETASEPQFVVITDQKAVLRDLWAQVKAPVVMTSTESTPFEPQEIVVAPVEVNPIVVKVLGELPIAQGGLPFILRVSADMAERSGK